MEKLKTVICVDIGTTSLKAALIKSDGTICAFSKIQFENFKQTEKSEKCQNNGKIFKIENGEKNTIWLDAFIKATKELLNNFYNLSPAPNAENFNNSKISQSPQQFSKNLQNFKNAQIAKCNQSTQNLKSTQKPIQIDGICISGNGPTFANEDFLHLWNDFNGTESEQKKYIKNANNSLFLPRLFYLKEFFPFLFNKKESNYFIFSGHEYLIFQLTNTAVTVLPEERYKIAYWDEDILSQNGILPNLLPPFVPAGFCAGKIKANIAKSLNLSENCQVYCGMPDFCAAILGTATTKPGFVCDRAGSSEGLNLCTKTPVQAFGIRTLPSIIPNLFNASVLLPNSGKKFSDFKENSIYKDLSFNETVLELLQKPNSTGFRLMQNIALDVKNSILLLEKHFGQKIESMRVTGGQAHTEEWNKFKANICQIKIEIGNSPDAELTGDAITAFYGMGLYNSLQEGAEKIFKVTKEFVPSNF